MADNESNENYSESLGLIRIGQQFSDYSISEIKSRISAQGQRMTKAEAYDKAWRLGLKGDFSLVDKIYHPDYSA